MPANESYNISYFLYSFIPLLFILLTLSSSYRCVAVAITINWVKVLDQQDGKN